MDNDYLYYTYKIESSLDEKYYIGRHKTNMKTIREMELDGYYGSGGTKYKNWLNNIPKGNIIKTIISIHNNLEDCANSEARLIGDSYKTDKNCKNSQRGGLGLGSYFPKNSLQNCKFHGSTLHLGKSCRKCSSIKPFRKSNCHIHGIVLFQKDTCLTCKNYDLNKKLECLNHGFTNHIWNNCQKCLNENLYKIKICEKHGNSIHMGESCKSCVCDS